MRILGIDPGTGLMGFGVIDSGSKPAFVDAGVIRTKPHQAESERLLIIYNALQEIVSVVEPSVVSVEKLFFARNVTTAMSVAQARGVVLLVAQQHNLPIYEYTPMQIKLSITGYGKADKKQMQDMVRVLLNLKQVPKPDDAADALAAALTHGAVVGM